MEDPDWTKVERPPEQGPRWRRSLRRAPLIIFLWWLLSMHGVMRLAWQSEQDAHRLYPMLLSLDKAAKGPNGDWLVCATAKSSEYMLTLPFTLAITIPKSSLEAGPREGFANSTLVDVPSFAQSKGCPLATSSRAVGFGVHDDSGDRVVNWITHAPMAGDEFRRLRSEAGKEATFFWVDSAPVLIFVSPTPLRTVYAVTDAPVDAPDSGSEIQEYYVAFILQPWNEPPRRWRLLYKVPLGILLDAILGPIEWFLFVT